MRIKLFWLADFLISIIVTSYVYFTNEVDVAIDTGISLFIAFSPIGLILASPAVLQFARGVLEKDNVTVNRLKAIENFPEVDTVAVPLNKFLTDGDYFVTDLVPIGLSQPSLLGVAATAEQKSATTLGRVIYKTAAGRGLKIQNIAASKEFAGQGVEVISSGSTIRLGTPEWVESQGVAIGNSLLTRIDKLCVYGKTVLVLGIGRMARGIIALKDEINFDAKEFLMLLKRKKFITVALTAAGKKTAKSLAKNFNLDAVKTNLSPADKSREVKILRAQGHTVAAISNDRDDMPALLAADVSIFWQQNKLASLIDEDAESTEREGSKLAEIRAELEKIPLVDDDEQVGTAEQNSATENKPAENKDEKVDYTDAVIDLEIPTLKHFFTIRKIALRAADLIKMNRYITYFSWCVLIPAVLMNTLAEPPIYIKPFMAIGGLAACIALILLNSLRMRSSD